jgi:hypothetical protein
MTFITDPAILSPGGTAEPGLPDPDLDNANACIRCAHWGAQSDVRETDRWRFCMRGEVHALAHRNFTCEEHERIPKSAALARLISEETNERV